MNLTKEKLLCLWNNREQIFKDKKNAGLIKRFEFVENLFNEISNNSLEIIPDDGGYLIKYGETSFQDKEQVIEDDYFNCSDSFGADGAMNGVIAMSCHLDSFKDIVLNIGWLLGGFNKGNQMKEEFRLLSANYTSNSDNGSLSTNQMQKKVSSNFADNNYFFLVLYEIKRIKDETFDPDDSKIVFGYPHQNYYKGKNRDEIKTAQRKALRHRFPYKFFYMWTHRDACIHLLSLMPYQKLAQCGDDCKHQDPGINMDFAQFADAGNAAGWKAYSDKIANYIEPDVTKRDDNFMSDLSKLLSIIAINEDQSIRNTEELLCTGNQAIILWGPPGTSKTFSAEMLVKSMLETEKLADVKFPKQSDKGCYELVQFHPNYAYEDFIGGIAPQVTGNTLAYTLKEGVFKKFCDQANQNTDKKYIFIIDEINRADLSSVFGELLYALEKRGQGVSIPNFTENDYKFVIPQNVYLIGTMNNVDKSLVSFDLALRRRFSFVKMMPDLSVLDTMLTGYSIGDGMTNSVEENNLDSYIKRCEWLNERISTSQTLGLNENYQIGQAYFMKIKDFLPKIEDEGKEIIRTLELEKLWEYHLLPLIEEYLGARADETDIKSKLKEIKAAFIQAL